MDGDGLAGGGAAAGRPGHSPSSRPTAVRPSLIYASDPAGAARAVTSRQATRRLT